MHSFASALIAAALATLVSAVPVGPPQKLPVSLPSGVLPPIPIPSGVVSSVGQVSSVTGEVGSLTGAVRVRDANSKITDAVKGVKGQVSDVGARDAQLSVADIFNTVLTEIEPFTEQLSTLTQHPYEPSLTCFDSLPRCLQLHDH